MPLEDVIAEHLGRLFPGMDVVAAHTFRVTRNEDLEVEEDDAEPPEGAGEGVAPPQVRSAGATRSRRRHRQARVDLLISELDVSRQEVFRLPGPLDLRGLHDVADLDREDLKYQLFARYAHASGASGIGFAS